MVFLFHLALSTPAPSSPVGKLPMRPSPQRHITLSCAPPARLKYLLGPTPRHGMLQVGNVNAAFNFYPAYLFVW
ncbi:hypothetical protein BO70DRAFT_362824 [Aspergillus heteromorphus CBS 117.55]|uniref:Ig-like domain-containing protein n=1 Tax=Aspergillus heteromorphus CBS 117.55 TaxID=1448321 RepID=A0A317W0Z1_9EURO|nr:uncharacterized protein BO70DRAFT_362824 [Aspergillus heteromorphus CBS 117.55]PWY79655.1 hypothetical protein BO70DRAFT_362824 [Aspergillus heteromorphus CBS 117.55]